MKESYTVLCDMDDVLCDLNTPWIKMLNDKHGTNIRREDISVWDIGEAIHSKFPSISIPDVFVPINTPGMFRNLPVVAGAKAGLKSIKDRGWRVVIVTSLPIVEHQPGQIVQEKMEWIEEHLSGLINPRDIILTYAKNLIAGDVLIDDGPHNLESFHSNTIVFDQPWNRMVYGSIRAFDWKDITPIIQAIINGKRLAGD